VGIGIGIWDVELFEEGWGLVLTWSIRFIFLLIILIVIIIGQL